MLWNNDRTSHNYCIIAFNDSSYNYFSNDHHDYFDAYNWNFNYNGNYYNYLSDYQNSNDNFDDYINCYNNIHCTDDYDHDVINALDN